MKFISKKSIPPESLLYTGEFSSETTIKHIQYNSKEVLEFDDKVKINDDVVDWIIVEGLSSVDTVSSLCREFGVDNLVIEDILNVNQRNKIEVFDSYIFAVQKYTYVIDSKLITDYISLLLFEDKLITFSEKKNLFINTILERVKIPNSLIRKFKHDYLFYVIYDIITDEVLHVFNYISDRVDKLEETILKLDRQDELTLYNLRKELVYIRNYSNQLQENLFMNKGLMEKLVDPKTSKYYEDLEDHIVNLNERVRTEIELLKGVFDIYMNNNADKMNKIMKTLTIFSAIFIPLSFLTGIFGMNFVKFPILSNDNGLLIFVIISILIPTAMLIYFKKNKWF